jgi:hypothetical protein
VGTERRGDHFDQVDGGEELSSGSGANGTVDRLGLRAEEPGRSALSSGNAVCGSAAHEDWGVGKGPDMMMAGSPAAIWSGPHCNACSPISEPVGSTSWSSTRSTG